MVSSTFKDLKEHRAALISAINKQGLKAEVMEDNDAAKAMDVIESSLKMVQDSDAVALVIGMKYGQIPVCGKNPKNLSITELEFDEAVSLNRPILLFLMADDHRVTKADIEPTRKNQKKLDAFRERAKQIDPDPGLHRVYVEFHNLEDFKEKAIYSIANLCRDLENLEEPPLPAGPPRDPIPYPPDLYAEPPYIGSHKFVGRKAQLETLDDWAAASDPHPVLLFDAVGGTGKSMLTWEWINRHATTARKDWAGRFWYSFYERGAIMADCCRCALAYMNRAKLEDYKELKPPELAQLLLHHLQQKPWLLILDGLERILVAYNRADAAELADEQADTAADQIANRDPCSAIRPEDDDLLRALAGAAKSKVLISSRLVPRVLLNPSGQAIPGVRREALPGLRPSDAEALLKSCGVKGDSQAIQDYLKTNCDCHPLVTGALAGLINDYLPDRGNFDAWVKDAKQGGARLNLAELDLTQRRNHILKASLEAVPPNSRRLLSVLAILSEAVDYATLAALNPFVPEEPKKVRNPEDDFKLRYLSEAEKNSPKGKYQAAVKLRKEYEQASEARLKSQEYLNAPKALAAAVKDLQHRGLLQYDGKRYDLHPVVRGVAGGLLNAEETQRDGQRVIDALSARPHSPWENAKTIEDVQDGVHVVRTLLRMGRYREACDAYRGDLSDALVFNLDAYPEVLSLLRPFFPDGWAAVPKDVKESDGSYLLNDASIALSRIGAHSEALTARSATLSSNLRREVWVEASIALSNLGTTLRYQNRLSQEDRAGSLGLRLAELIDNQERLFRSRLDRFSQLAILGRWKEAQAMWDPLNPMGRDWSRAAYRPGDAESWYAVAQFWQGKPNESRLASAQELAEKGNNPRTVRGIHSLRGQWLIEQGDWAIAAKSLNQAVQMARAARQYDARSETYLKLAQFHLGDLANPRDEAEQLESAEWVDDRALAELWLAIGDREKAKYWALEAYRWAGADGEPFVQRYELTKSRALLETLGAEIEDLPCAKYEKFPCEDEVEAAIKKLEQQKAGKKKPKPQRIRKTT